MSGLASVPPSAGKGLHLWILSYTRNRLVQGQTEEEVKAETLRLCKDKGRKPEILGKEIADAVKGALEWLEDHPNASVSASGSIRKPWGWWLAQAPSLGIRRPPAAHKWIADPDPRLVKHVFGKIGEKDLSRLVPRDALDIGELFGNINFPVCLAREVNRPVAKPLRQWQRQEEELRAGQWMVPNPCLRCGEGGGVKSDKNAGERLWLIIEFDQWTIEEQAKLLLWLNKIDAEWDLSLIVFSGSKSLHGWFSTVGKSERREILRFFKLACRLGCDRAMRSSVQYTRMPLGVNAKTKRIQEILHLDEDALEMHAKRLKEEYA
jgi:hypothetical protein